MKEKIDWENIKKEKEIIITSWIESTLVELNFAEYLQKLLISSSTKEEFVKLARAKLETHQNPWTKDNFKSILDLVTD